jgi:hypothetical protein
MASSTRSAERALAGLALAGAVLVAVPAAAADGQPPRPYLYLGASVGMALLPDTGTLFGDARDIFEGLDGEVAMSGLARPMFELREVVPLLPWLAVDLRQEFTWTGFAAQFPTTPELDSAYDRYLVTLGAGLQTIFGQGRHSFRFSAAPALVVVVTERKGWLGEGRDSAAAAGGLLAYGWWWRVTDQFALSVEQLIWLVDVPRGARLLDDGGTLFGWTLAIGGNWSPGP